MAAKKPRARDEDGKFVSAKAIVSELGWTLRDAIEEEVSIATMMSYCQYDIKAIIEELTETFSGGQ